MERIMKSQAFADPTRAQFLSARKTLEINPRHPVIIELKARAAEDAEATNEETRDVARLIYDTALMNSGFSMEDPKDFSARVLRLLKSGLNLPSLDLVPEVQLPAEEEEEEAGEEEGEEEAGDDSVDLGSAEL
jgi:heat shock protein 90kDa beta